VESDERESIMNRIMKGFSKIEYDKCRKLFEVKTQKLSTFTFMHHRLRISQGQGQGNDPQGKKNLPLLTFRDHSRFSSMGDQVHLYILP